MNHHMPALCLSVMRIIGTSSESVVWTEAVYSFESSGGYTGSREKRFDGYGLTYHIYLISMVDVFM